MPSDAEALDYLFAYQFTMLDVMKVQHIDARRTVEVVGKPVRRKSLGPVNVAYGYTRRRRVEYARET